MSTVINSPQPDPNHIMQIGLGFWASKTLLTATQIGIFTLLGERPYSAREIAGVFQFGCSERHLYDFLDTLVSLGFLTREGLLNEALYSNAVDTDFFLDRKKPTYLGGILEMADRRLYQFWGNLQDGLKTGLPQNEVKTGAPNPFETIYADKTSLREFMRAMAGLQMGNFFALASKFNFLPYHSVCDAGGADATLSILLAQRHTHLNVINLDLPPVTALALENVEKAGLSERVQAVSGDFFQMDLPKADVVIMGNILHDWDETSKLSLIRKAYDALPPGGALVCIENVIDEARKENTFGMLMSLNMLIEFGDSGFDYTLRDFQSWTAAAGFKRSELLPLAGPSSAAIAYK